jgi:hypothetical protein
MKRWLGLCSLFALAALIPRGLATGEAGATPKESGTWRPAQEPGRRHLPAPGRSAAFA